jgi:hypothetical protein
MGETVATRATTYGAEVPDLPGCFTQGIARRCIQQSPRSRRLRPGLRPGQWTYRRSGDGRVKAVTGAELCKGPRKHG